MSSCIIFLTKFLLKLPIEPICNIYVVYKNKISKLQKKKVSQWMKNISTDFYHYNLINEEELTVQYGM